MYWRYLSIAIGAVVLVSAQNGSRAAEWQVVPDVRVGPVTRTSTEISLIASLGKDAIKQDIVLDDGETQPALVIYKGDPTRQLEVVWNRDVPAHPAFVEICRGFLPSPPPCRWRTAEGVGLGTTLRELERLNRNPFIMVCGSTDEGGTVMSFEGGALSSFIHKSEPEPWNSHGLILQLVPRLDEKGEDIPKLGDEERAQVYGTDKDLPSSNPVLQKINPYVAKFSVIFPLGEVR